jgi:hypothetical protein
MPFAVPSRSRRAVAFGVIAKEVHPSHLIAIAIAQIKYGASGHNLPSSAGKRSGYVIRQGIVRFPEKMN